MKFWNSRSVFTVRHKFNPEILSSFKVNADDALKKINLLSNIKEIQSTDIPVKILNKYADISGSYECHVCNIYSSQQITPFMYLFLTKLQHSLSKGYSSQHCLLVVLEKWKRAVDTGKDIGAPLTDLLETFDSLSHKLIIAKPCAYEFNFSAINLIQNF